MSLAGVLDRGPQAAKEPELTYRYIEIDIASMVA
jgi:hypothetical protein